MARLDLAPQVASRVGANLAFTVANTDGHKWVYTGQHILLARNTNAATRDLTLQVTRNVDGLVVPDRVITIPVTTGFVFIREADYEKQTNGEIWLDYSATAGVDVALIR